MVIGSAVFVVAKYAGDPDMIVLIMWG